MVMMIVASSRRRYATDDVVCGHVPVDDSRRVCFSYLLQESFHDPLFSLLLVYHLHLELNLQAIDDVICSSW